MRVAIDNRLESLKIQEVSDFTTLRVLEHSSLNVRNLIRFRCVEIAKHNGFIFLDVGKFNWSSGRAVNARDWIYGIQYAIDSNPAIKILASNIGLKFKIAKDILIVKSELDSSDLIHLLCISIFSPLGLHDEVSGPYRIVAHNDGWAANSIRDTNEYNSSKFFYVVEDPHKAVRLFNHGLLDKTPETCFPLELFESKCKFMKRYSSDLFGYISFSKDFSKTASDHFKEAIFNVITNMKLSNNFELRWNSIKYKNEKTYHPNKVDTYPNLKISYDKIYPNELFCEDVSRELDKAGIKAELIGGDYGIDPVDWDIRFHIVHFYGLPGKWQDEFCRSTGAKYSCEKVGDKYLAKNLGGGLNSFPVCNIPLSYLERFG